MYPRRLVPDTIRSVAYSALTGSYTAIGTALTNPARLIRFVNDTDQDVYISWDGTANHQFLPGGSFILLDVSTNKIKDDGLFIPIGQVFYAKYNVTPPSSGILAIEVYVALGGEQTSVPPVNP